MPSMKKIKKEEEGIKFNPLVFKFIAKLKVAVNKRRKMNLEIK